MKLAIVLLIISALAVAHNLERRRRIAAERQLLTLRAAKLQEVRCNVGVAQPQPARLRYGSIPPIESDIWCQSSENYGFRARVVGTREAEGIVDRLIVRDLAGGELVSVSLDDVVPL